MSRRKKKPELAQIGWVIYKRTSDEYVQTPERSQDSQQHLIEECLIKPSGLPLLKEYCDTETGTTAKRKAYQQLLADARQKKFSHIAVSHVDRFGRDDVEALRAIDELVALGITVRVASYPGLDPANPDGRMIVGVLFNVARLESKKIAQRVRGAQYIKLCKGGWAWRAPDGYRNREERL